MNALAQSLIEHTKIIDHQNDLLVFTGKSLTQWMEPLANSITENGYVPYLIETGERYRASPLSSTISWLSGEGLLPHFVLMKMQDALLSLRDNNVDNDPDQGNDSKLAEDQDGWSLGEGVSVWSTSMAIIAMLDEQGFGLKKAKDLKPSILWLVKQQRTPDKGWAYQSHNNCSVNVVMTALTLHALSLSISAKNKDSFLFTDDEYNQIYSAIHYGFEYIQSTRISYKGMDYWSFNERPHCAATTWVLTALYYMSQIDDSRSSSFREYYSKVLDGGLKFVLSKMPSKMQKWESEQIVLEGGAKYNKQKNYYSYSATLLTQLFRLGLSPYHPKVICQIRWLSANPSDWKITSYDKMNTCTFTYAMILSVLTSWAKRVGTAFSTSIGAISSNKKDALLEKVFGYRFTHLSPMQPLLKKRLLAFSIITITLIIVAAFGNNINHFVKESANNIVNIWDKTTSDRHDILIDIIAAAIYTITAAILGFLWKIINSYRRRRS